MEEALEELVIDRVCESLTDWLWLAVTLCETDCDSEGVKVKDGVRLADTLGVPVLLEDKDIDAVCDIEGLAVTDRDCVPLSLELTVELGERD